MPSCLSLMPLSLSFSSIDDNATGTNNNSVANDAKHSSKESPSLRESGGAAYLRRLRDKEIKALDLGTLYTKHNPQDPTLPNVDSRTRRKLSQPLLKKKKKELGPISQGLIESHAEDLHEVVFDAFQTVSFYGIFKGVRDTSKVIHIDSVMFNKDGSHAYVMWSSFILNRFAFHMQQKMGDEEAFRFVKKATNYMNKRLKTREGKLRHKIVQKMTFKRVPRIYFKPTDAQFELKTKEQIEFEQAREQILRDLPVQEEEDGDGDGDGDEDEDEEDYLERSKY